MSMACMGGWCTLRDRCRRHTQDDRALVSERLCEPGEDDAFQPGGARAVGTWELRRAYMLRPATWLNVVEPA